MKTNIKRLLCVLVLVLVFSVCACGKTGKILSEIPNDNIKMTAYIYETKLPEGERFCLSLLDSDEELNMNIEPNVYKSEYLFEVSWDGNNLKVKQNENDKTVEKMKVIKDVIISFGDSEGLEPDGIKREEKDPNGTKTAYLYLKTEGSTKQYCLSLLDEGETPDINSEPNVYKSTYEFNFEWSDGMLCVMQNAKDTSKNDVLMIDDVLIAFGNLSGDLAPSSPSENNGSGIIKEEANNQGKKACLYSENANGKTRYCLSLLKEGEEPDMSKKANVYESDFEFDFYWDDDMLFVEQNKDDKTINDAKTVDGVMIVFGTQVVTE